MLCLAGGRLQLHGASALDSQSREHSASIQGEMTSRLRRSLIEFKDASDRWQRGLVVLTIVLILLTAALVYFGWALLNRA
jgi:hypothetical protein